jgi:hypothetical protein
MSFAKIPRDAESIISKFSPSTYDIRVEVYSNYDFYDVLRVLYQHSVTGELISPANLNTDPPRYTSEQVRNASNYSTKNEGYWGKLFNMSTILYLQGAPQTLVDRSLQFVDIPIPTDWPNTRQSPILDDSITRDYDTTVEGIKGRMPILGSFSSYNHRRPIAVDYDDGAISLTFWWMLPFPLHFTREWWNKAHDIMRKDASRLLAKFMAQLFSPFLPPAPLNSTNWKLVDASSLDVNFWSDILKRNKNGETSPNIYFEGVGTAAIIKIQNNRSTRLSKTSAVVTELKF